MNDEISNAPLRVIKKAHLHAPPEQVFAKVSDHDNLEKWVPMIKHSSVDHSRSVDGNVCGYAFSVKGKNLPTSRHLAVFTIEDDGQGGSILTTRQFFYSKKSLKGLIMPVIMGIVLTRALKNLIRAFGGEIVKAR